MTECGVARTGAALGRRVGCGGAGGGCGDWPPVEGQRVPTRFVQKYTLGAQPETSGAHEAVEGRAGDAGDRSQPGTGRGSPMREAHNA